MAAMMKLCDEAPREVRSLKKLCDEAEGMKELYFGEKERRIGYAENE